MSPIKFPKEKTQERKLGIVRVKEEEEAAKKSAKLLGFPYINLTFKPIDREALEIVPEHEAKEAGLAVISKKGQSLAVAVADPQDPDTKKIIENLKDRFENVSMAMASPHSLKKAWSGYKQTALGKEKISGEVDISPRELEKFRKEIRSIEDLGEAIGKISSQKNASLIAELLLASALALDASDVHIEPQEKDIRLRLRIDGLMRDASTLDAHIYKLLLSRIKLLSEMKLNIKNAAQDGRFSVSFGKFEIQIRSSVLPGAYGENIVLRVLDPASLLSMEQLGIREDLLKIVEKQITKPNGMILTTGPTGSGKTTTLYAFLKKLKTPEVKIITVEDPIEYHLEGISQTQVSAEHGYTFASGLRSILRQDPDIILIGEIRDLETADTALQASLTGHLLLSTLHTNDVAGVVPRLVDLGASSSVIGPAMNMAIAQRLVRRTCEKCKRLEAASAEELSLLKAELANLPSSLRLPKEIAQGLKLPRTKGCDTCHSSGYKGRVGVYEILVNDAEFEKFILENPPITKVRQYTKEKGMITMKQDGFLRVLEGITTIEEVERVTGE